LVGAVVASGIVLGALAAVSEIVLPLTFASMLAVIFKPAVSVLERRGLGPSVSAGLVVAGLLASLGAIAVAVLVGLVDQAADIGSAADRALDRAATEADDMGASRASLEDAREATEELAPMIAGGFLTAVVSGVGALVGLASGIILGALIMYYLLKDGTRIRRAVVLQLDPAARGEADRFVGDSCRILRQYGRGRTVMSSIVSATIGLVSLLLGLPLLVPIMLVNFVGGYIPYIGAFLGGGLAFLVALGEGGVADAVIMLVVVVAANLLLENLVEPRVMGRTLDIHPLTVLVVTAIGGVVGGIVGLILAVPTAAIAGHGLARLRSRGFFDRVAERAEPTVHRMLR
jgi:predicted PurR-regulated permease PerM